MECKEITIELYDLLCNKGKHLSEKEYTLIQKAISHYSELAEKDKIIKDMIEIVEKKEIAKYYPDGVYSHSLSVRDLIDELVTELKKIAEV